MKKYKKIIYYLIIILLFIIFDKVLYIFPNNKNNIHDYIATNTCEDLKKEVEYLSNLNYDKYDYEIGKITYKNLYNTNSYIIESNNNYNDNIVLNNKGMIGILNNKILTLVKDLNISVKINNNYGILKNNKVSIIDGNYLIGDEVYTSGIGKINASFLIGYISDIKHLSNEDIISINYLDINSSYVVILR